MPARVATHFGLDGQPDGWMSRAGFQRFAIVFPCVLAAFCVGLGYSARYLDPSTLHVQNPEYWQQPAHYAEACDRLTEALAALSIAMVGLFALVWRLVVRAQRFSPPRMDPKGLALATIPFMVFLAGWLVWLSSLFRLPA